MLGYKRESFEGGYVQLKLFVKYNTKLLFMLLC